MGMRVGGMAAAAFVAMVLLFTGTAAAEAPAPPTITEPAADGQLVHPADVHMEATGFADPDPDSHRCTDWQILDAASFEVVWRALCATGVEKVHIHLGDGTFVGSYAGRTKLNFSSSYILRVRFQDDHVGPSELSDWSQRSFGTYPASAPGGAIPWTPLEPGYVIDEIAGGLQLALDIAFVPNPGNGPKDPLLYVTELYGSIKVVARDGTVSNYATGLLNYNPTGKFPGSGTGGLAGITVDPDSGDVFAGMLYDPDDDPFSEVHYPKVVRLHSTDGGRTAATRTTILDMAGENQPSSHQVSDLSIGPDDGKLYIHMGDGFDPTTATNLNSLRGKILRVNLDGTAPEDNPFFEDGDDGTLPRDYIYAYGFRNPFGGAWRANGAHYEVENGPKVDRLARVDEGVNYTYDGTDLSMRFGALYNWEPAHAPVNIAFVEPGTFGGSGFPAVQQDHAFVTESGATWASGPQLLGKRIVEFDPDPVTGEIGGHPHTLVEYTGTGKATAAGLAPGPDGLYFTELYRDLGYVSPIDPGARLLRIRYGPPVRPILTGTNPPSPADRNSPRVLGSAQFGSTVRLYADPACQALLATGTSDQLSSAGIPVNVPDNSTTTLYANDRVGAVTSGCSSTAVTYVEKTGAGSVRGTVDINAATFDIKAAKKRCKKKFHGAARAKCIKRVKRKARAA